MKSLLNKEFNEPWQYHLVFMTFIVSVFYLTAPVIVHDLWIERKYKPLHSLQLALVAGLFYAVNSMANESAESEEDSD